MAKHTTLDEKMASENGIALFHHFGDNEYAKEVRVPKGMFLRSHKHKYGHLSILASGTAIVRVGSEEQTLTGPACLNISAGMEHKVVALTDIVWYCLHGTNKKDVSEIDGDVIER